MVPVFVRNESLSGDVVEGFFFSGVKDRLRLLVHAALRKECGLQECDCDGLNLRRHKERFCSLMSCVLGLGHPCCHIVLQWETHRYRLPIGHYSECKITSPMFRIRSIPTSGAWPPLASCVFLDKDSSKLCEILMQWCRAVVPWWASPCVTSVPDVMPIPLCQKCPDGVRGISAVLSRGQTHTAPLSSNKYQRQWQWSSRLDRTIEHFC